MQSPFQGALKGVENAFVFKLNPAGDALVYSTYLGGSGVEGPPAPTTFADDSAPGNIVAVDAAGLVYVTGFTDSAGGAGAKLVIVGIQKLIEKDKSVYFHDVGQLLIYLSHLVEDQLLDGRLL